MVSVDDRNVAGLRLTRVFNDFSLHQGIDDAKVPRYVEEHVTR